MATVKSSAENLTLNADGANNDIIFQSNGSNVATLDQAGLLTATTFAGSGASLTALPAANITGTLPAISGANLTGFTDSQMPAGSVLQVVIGSCSTEVDTDSSSYVASPLAATITPSNASNKILITYSAAFYHYTDVNASTTIYRGGTDIAAVGSNHGVMRSWVESSRGYHLHGGQLLDSPSTTSATTYTVYVKKNSGSYTIGFPTAAADTFPSITLMEIAG